LDDITEVADPAMWVKAQPNIGITVSYDTYHKDVERAEKVPAARNDILAKRFGIPMEGFTYFFTYEETIPHAPREFWGMRCALGADLSQGDDFCAFTALFPLQNGGFGVKTRSYITHLTLMKLPLAMRMKYEEFIAEGSLQIFDTVILDDDQVFEDVDAWIIANQYDVCAFGFDPYNAKAFVDRWERENGPYGIEKVVQGSRTESVPLGDLKNLAEEQLLIFDQQLMSFAMGNAITIEDTNGNRKLLKRRAEEKIDNVSAAIDAYVAWKRNPQLFD
jgi:phage terminase large subunit-like protein